MRKQEDSRPLIIRYTIAVIGAVSITIGLLLFMNDLVSRFMLRDPTRYFVITDFIPAPDRGRQLPSIPVSPAAAPDAPVIDLDIANEVMVDAPVVGADAGVPVLEQPPTLDE